MAGNGHAEEHHGGGPSFYLLIAAILGVITFVEFALIQWPQAWLSTPAAVTVLIALSVAKFLMVVAYFMHLRDDENSYSGFFGSGMVIAMGTFVALAFLFTVPSVANALRGADADDHEVEAVHVEDEGHGGIPEEVLASIESEGYSRETAEILDSPRPKDQSLRLTLPAVGDEIGYTLNPAPGFGDTVPDGEAAPTPEAGGPAGGDPVGQAATGLGLEIYNRNCVGCHQGTGRGIPGAFPPLAGHLPTLYAVEGGRSYLINTVLYGLQGPITADGQNFNSVMPAWAQLDDDSIAAVLNYTLTDWDNDTLIDDFVPIDAAEVAAERGNDLGPGEVLGLRSALDLP